MHVVWFRNSLSHNENILDQELVTAAKHGLYWGGMWLEDEDGGLLADGRYLYQPLRASETFFLLFDKLRQLNDYCFNQLISSEAKLAELSEQRDAAIADRSCGAEVLDYFHDEIPLWEDSVSVVAKAMPVVLLCSFAEWGLKLVSKEICGDVPRKTNRTMSDIEFLVGHIENVGNLQLDSSSELVSSINSFRSIRNSFAHGHWDELRVDFSGLSLRSCFESVSELFQQIEEAAWRSPWGAV